MLTSSPSAAKTASPAAADSAVPAERVTDMERLALALLKCAEKFEVEAGLAMQVTPALSVEELAGLAGIGDYSAGLMLEYLLEGGFITRRRQRFVLHMPQALYRLALGAKPV
jgi:hypothetical protein